LSNGILLKSLRVFLVRGFGAVAGFLLTLSVTNLTDSDSAGLFLFSISLVNVLGVLACVGAPNVLIKIVGAGCDGDWRLINDHFSVVIKVAFAIGVAITLFLCFFPAFFVVTLPAGEGMLGLLPYVGFTAISFSLIQLFASALQGKHDSVKASVLQNVFSACNVYLGSWSFVVAQACSWCY